MRLKNAEFKILQCLRDSHVFPNLKGTIHLLISGGKDSVALLEVLHQIQRLPHAWSGVDLQLYLHHFNHKQRGMESDDDAILCIEHAKRLGYPISIYCWNKELDDRLEQGENFQSLARSWRYDTVRNFAEELARGNGDSNWVIATAHHRRDQAETFLQNLARGCGISGLQGLSVWNPSTRLFRPLLCLSITEVERYIESKTLPHRHDSSNDEIDYTRNKIRMHVLRNLEEINPKITEHIWTLSQEIREESCSSKISDQQKRDGAGAECHPTTRMETASIDSLGALHAFIISATRSAPVPLTRQKLANILSHIHKLTKRATPGSTYIFALSPKYALKIDNKQLEILATSR